MTSIGQCAICFSSLGSAQAYAIVKCGHTFHEKCAHRWIVQAKNCPSCRVKATPNDLLKLFFHERSVDDTFSQDTHASDKIIELEAKIECSNEKIQQLISTTEVLLSEKKSLMKQISDKQKQVENVQILTAQNRSLEDRLHNYNQMKEKLENVQNLLRACDFYKLITEKTGNVDEIGTYLLPNGNVDDAKFFELLKEKNATLNSRFKESQASKKAVDKELASLKKERVQLQSLIKDLQEENKKYKESLAFNQVVPPTPNSALKDISNYTPEPNRSLGFTPEVISYSKSVIESAYNQKRNREQPPRVIKPSDSPQVKRVKKPFVIDPDEDDFLSSPRSVCEDVTPVVPKFSRYASASNIGPKFGTTVNDKKRAPIGIAKPITKSTSVKIAPKPSNVPRKLEAPAKSSNSFFKSLASMPVSGESSKAPKPSGVPKTPVAPKRINTFYDNDDSIILLN